ncbi:hypothetical protein KAR52_00740 [Candidatus Pacearchaeota archaeon]|nr:hypothetical protein [Candidatus Pacearchaeota archaeon]
MDKEKRKIISEDYKIVNDSISEILSYERPNFTVIARQYLSPTLVMTDPLKMNDNCGELAYFKEIRDCLEEILINEKSFSKIFNAPEYVQEFLK